MIIVSLLNVLSVGRLRVLQDAAAGWLAYGGLLEKLEARKSKVLAHICGVVCDSCPEPTVQFTMCIICLSICSCLIL